MTEAVKSWKDPVHRMQMMCSTLPTTSMWWLTCETRQVGEEVPIYAIECVQRFWITFNRSITDTVPSRLLRVQSFDSNFGMAVSIRKEEFMELDLGSDN